MKFSILIPAYKSKFLCEAIESVLAQTYENFELIIVDDCSPEDIKSVVDSFCDSRIRYFRNENNCGAINVVDNWNICLSYSSGDYVICMGDDDRLLPCSLEEYRKIIKKFPKLKLYHAWTEVIDEKGEIISITTKPPLFESALSFIYGRYQGRLLFIGDFCYEVKCLRDSGGFYKLPLAWGSDEITAVRASLFEGVAHTQKICFQYRMNSRSITSDMTYCGLKMCALAKVRKWYKDNLRNIKFEDLCEDDKWYYNRLKSKMIVNNQEKYIISKVIQNIYLKLFHLLQLTRISGRYKRDS